MFVFSQGSPLPLSYMMLVLNVTAFSPGRSDLYQDRYDYNKEGYFYS